MKNTFIVKKGFQYDDERYVEPGEYEFCEKGVNGWPMILVNDEWLDIVLDEFSE